MCVRARARWLVSHDTSAQQAARTHRPGMIWGERVGILCKSAAATVLPRTFASNQQQHACVCVCRISVTVQKYVAALLGASQICQRRAAPLCVYSVLYNVTHTRVIRECEANGRAHTKNVRACIRFRCRRGSRVVLGTARHVWYLVISGSALARVHTPVGHSRTRIHNHSERLASPEMQPRTQKRCTMCVCVRVSVYNPLGSRRGADTHTHACTHAQSMRM